MAKLYFYYSAMNAGKSTILLQSNYNYRERGMETLVLTPEIDSRFSRGKVTSRIGIEADATTFNQFDDLLSLCKRAYETNRFHCVLVDEAQFLSRLQVKQLSDVCDTLNVPVLAYGLRTDFQGNLFEGSMQLLAWADTWLKSRQSVTAGERRPWSFESTTKESRSKKVLRSKSVAMNAICRFAVFTSSKGWRLDALTNFLSGSELRTTPDLANCFHHLAMVATVAAYLAMLATVAGDGGYRSYRCQAVGDTLSLLQSVSASVK